MALFDFCGPVLKLLVNICVLLFCVVDATYVVVVTGINNTTTPTAETVCRICDKEAAESCDAGLCTDCCKSNTAESIDCCDGHWIENAGSRPNGDSDDDDAPLNTGLSSI